LNKSDPFFGACVKCGEAWPTNTDEKVDPIGRYRVIRG